MLGKNQNSPILPYHLRVEIWDLIDQGSSNEEIVDKLYCDAPPNVSEGKFRFCIRGIKGIHTKGLRPSKR